MEKVRGKIEEKETLPGLFLRNYRKYGDRRVALRKKDFGIWQHFTWKDYYDDVKSFCLGLIGMGLEPGDMVFIIGNNDPHWIYAEMASQAAGACISSFYQDAQPPELKYVVNHCDAKFVVAEDQEQVDKILQIRENLPKLKRLIYWDPKGLRHYDDPLLMSVEEVQRLGSGYEREHPGLFEELVERVEEDDLAMLCYTSGTTGFPKGAMLTHRQMVTGSRIFQQFVSMREDDNLVSFAPLCWNGEQCINIVPGMISGSVVNFYEEQETVQDDIREIAPPFILGMTRMWENILSGIQVKMTDASSFKDWAYRLFMPLGYKVADLKIAGRGFPLVWRMLHVVGYFLLFRPLRDKVGLLKTRKVMVGGAAVGEDLMRFYWALGVPFLQCYGITEAGGAVTFHREEDIKFNTAGVPLCGYELQISDRGELRVRGDSVFAGYLKDPNATQKTLLRGGWVQTGDASLIDEDGHLVCIDRMSDLMTLKDGSRFAPSYLEVKLKFSPYVRDSLAFGEKKDYVVALVSIDPDNMGRWAEAHHITYTTFADLSQKPEVYDMIRKEVAMVNRVLPQATQIRRFANLHKELDPDDAELTRTRKVRRGLVEDRYRELLDAIYGDAPEFRVESEVKYRDGRTGMTRTAIKIIRVEG